MSGKRATGNDDEVVVGEASRFGLLDSISDDTWKPCSSLDDG